jgi:hypothetical protein
VTVKQSSVRLDSQNPDRVADIAVACVQALARRRLGIVIPEEDVRELILVYGDIESAIEALEKINEVHGATGSREHAARMTIAEATVASKFATKESIKAIVAIREETHRNRQQCSKAVAEARRADLERDLLSSEIRRWAEDHRAFFNELDSLFSKTRNRLHLLGLAQEDLADALAKAELIMDSAINRYQRLGR